MERVSIAGLTVANTSANMSMIKKREWEHIFGQMVKYMKVAGSMESSTEKEFTQINKANHVKAYGKMVSEHFGHRMFL